MPFLNVIFIVQLSVLRLLTSYLLDVHIVQVVLYELDGGVEVGLVEFVGDVPPQRAVLSPLLDCAMEEGYSVQHGPPLHHVTDVQQVLIDAW